MLTGYNALAMQGTPTRDDNLGPGNTAPIGSQTQPPPNMVGMGGSMMTRPLPLNTVQQPFGGIATMRPPVSSANAQGGVSYREGDNSPGAHLMPGGVVRNPATRQGGIMTQSHPDFIGRQMSDMSGGVRPGRMPPMNAVQTFRQQQGMVPGQGPMGLGQMPNRPVGPGR